MKAAAVVAEVQGLHAFIQHWFNGSVPKTRESFRRLTQAWPRGFTLVAPNNVLRRSSELLASTYSLHARFPGLSIEIRNPQVRIVGNNAIAVYEEWHVDPALTEARLCSASFATEGRALRWLHVHESSLKAARQNAAPSSVIVTPGAGVAATIAALKRARAQARSPRR